MYFLGIHLRELLASSYYSTHRAEAVSMGFGQLQSSVLVFTVCLVLVITRAGNFKVSAAAQQYEAKTLEGGCPNSNDDDIVRTVRINVQQYIGPLIEQVSEIISQTTVQNTESPTTGQTTEQSISTSIDPLYTCNGTPGWKQVVFINMTDNSYNCPPGLNLTSYSKRTCGRAHTNRGNCSSTTFSVGGSEYSQVCGRIRGYQVGSTGAFLPVQSIDDRYLDGVSLTHGAAGSREHIWSFPVGLSEVDPDINQILLCPCDTSNEATVSPPFVGNDYFCESGLHSPWPGRSYFSVPFLDDPLWDGQNCTSTSTCCQLNNPPWFTKTLPNITTDDIELRLCFSGKQDDTPLDLIELYIQ